MRVIAVMAAGLLAGCGAKGDDVITVISREEGSGTRGAFMSSSVSNRRMLKAIRLIIQPLTRYHQQHICHDDQCVWQSQAIGYISLGSLNNTVKALEIDNTTATVENIKSGSYQVSRPSTLQREQMFQSQLKPSSTSS